MSAIADSLSVSAKPESMMDPQQTDRAAPFYAFSLERHVPTSHLLRAIDRFVYRHIAEMPVMQEGSLGAARPHDQAVRTTVNHSIQMGASRRKVRIQIETVAALLRFDLLRNPCSVAALAFEHVKGSPGRRVKHACSELWLVAAARALLRDGLVGHNLVHSFTSAGIVPQASQCFGKAVIAHAAEAEANQHPTESSLEEAAN